MRAIGGAVNPTARCSSKSYRICQIRPSAKPIGQRVSDFDNHQQHQSHRYLPLEPMSLGCPSEGYRSVFHTAALVNRAGAGRQQSTHQCIYCPLSVVCLPRQPIFLHWRVITSGHFRIIGSTLPMRLDGESQFGVLAEPGRPSLRICPGNG